MGRPVMLGNGSLTVGLNEQGLVKDFYFPYVGLDNLSTARMTGHKIGVWVEDSFSWVDDDTWQIDIDFSSDALISQIKMVNTKLEVTLEFQDFVDSEINLFGRQIKITNKSDRKREIRLFLHQVFQISRAGRADTGLFEPELNYILDYKGRCSLLIYAQDEDKKPFDQFAIGNYGIEGKQGTFVDAEDGQLSNSPVEHGGVDSVIRFSRDLDASTSTIVDYWIIAADSQFNCEKIHSQVLANSLSERLNITKSFWNNWFEIAEDTFKKLSERDAIATKKSLMVIKAHIDKRGGIIASCDSSIYNYGRDYYSYVWPRDGAYAIWPLIKLGYTDEPKRFFYFCRDILTSDGFLMHKYQPDRAIGSTWHPLLHGKHKELAIQEDETATVVFMLSEYYKYTNDSEFIRELYDTFIQPACNFMSEFIDPQTNLPHATYDLWEEKFLTSTYTTSIVYKSLLSAVVFAEMFEYPNDIVKWKEAADKISTGLDQLFSEDRQLLIKGFLLQEDGSLQNDNTLDISSFYGATTFELPVGINHVHQTAMAAEKILLDQSPSKGSPRYEHDNYFATDTAYQGNPWFVTTLWLAQYYAKTGDIDKAKSYIDWTLSHSYKSGILAEQINPNSGESISVAPLVWSHAELINTILVLEDLKN